MKKLLLLLLISNFAFSQNGIEFRLVNANVGTPQCGYFFNDWMCNSTNDAGLNTILSNYNVQFFKEKGGHPYPLYNGKIIGIQGDFPQQFITDLQAYSSVIEMAHFSDMTVFSDALDVYLNDPDSGTPTGVSGNIIVTNSAELNQIFQTYSVIQFELGLPTISQTYYVLTCDCDAALLKTALENLAVVAQASQHGPAFLSNQQLEKPKAVISPNPFSNDFDIETEQTITNYSIIDITGKIIVITSSKSDLDNQSSHLSAGMYVLNLTFENGQAANFKLVKK